MKDQFIKALKRQESGEKVIDICREMGTLARKLSTNGRLILEAWRSQKLRALEDENRRVGS